MGLGTMGVEKDWGSRVDRDISGGGCLRAAMVLGMAEEAPWVGARHLG